MIVVDSNVIAYCWLNGPLTAVAPKVRARDPEWHVPILWRSELRSILTGYLRDGSLSRPQTAGVMDAIEDALAGSEHLVSSAEVIKIAESSRLSAYNCEFVALASTLAIPLVTVDKAVLKEFPEIALSMESFLKA